MGGQRQKRDFHVTFRTADGRQLTETVNIENEYLAGNLILKANRGSTLLLVTQVRVFQSVCPVSGTLIFEGDPTRVKHGKVVARVDY